MDDRVIILARYITQTHATLRHCAKVHGISKSTVHTDVTRRLPEIDRNLYEQVRMVLDKNKSERHLRGGFATKQKHLKNKNDR